MSTVGSTPSISGTLGIGSGLDLDSLVSGLMAVASQPMTDLQNKASAAQTQISAYGMLQGALSTLQTAVDSLTSDNFKAQSVTSSNGSVVTATSDGTAAAGSYAVSVQQLAQPEKAVGVSVPTSTIFTAGKITLKLGSVSGGTFTAGSADPVNIDIRQGSTLQDVRDAINAANAGVTASIVNDGTGSRLVLASSTTGAEQRFQLTTTDTGGSGASLAQFAYDPATADSYDADNPPTTGGMSTLQAAQDAKATISGVVVTSSSNTISNAVDGLTFTLGSAVTPPATGTITVASNSSQAQSTLQAFVTAYNTFLSTVNSLSSNDPSTSTGETNSSNGPLSGSSVVRSLLASIQNQIYTPLASASSGSSYTSLASLGVTFEKDGTLSLNTDVFSKAMASDGTQIAKMFASSTLASSNDASTLTGRFNAMFASFLGSTGQITAQVSALDDTTTQIQQQEADLQVRLDAIQANYTARFTALDTLLTNMKSTQSYLTTQLEALAQQRAQIANGT